MRPWVLLVGALLVAALGCNQADSEGTYLDAETAPKELGNVDQAKLQGLSSEEAKNMAGVEEDPGPKK